jgi:DNA-binding NarL/FixJ family response regulator
LIRVGIIADSPLRARNLARLLSEEEWIEVLDSETPAAPDSETAFLVDVIVAAGLGADQLPSGSAPVVALSENADAMPIGPGIRACLPLNASTAEIVAAIVAAANDLTVLTQAQIRRGFRAGESMQRGALVESLTPRELQVLKMLADGLGNKEIAGQLGISDHTAKFHVTQILGKLGAASRTEAVAIGIRQGLVPI